MVVLESEYIILHNFKRKDWESIEAKQVIIGLIITVCYFCDISVTCGCDQTIK